MTICPIQAKTNDNAITDETSDVEIIIYYNDGEFVRLEEGETRVIGTLYYIFIITVSYIAGHGQVVSNTILFLSDLYDCYTLISDRVDDYVNGVGGLYVSHNSQYQGTVVDNGCWSQYFPSNPFCKIILSKSDDA